MTEHTLVKQMWEACQKKKIFIHKLIFILENAEGLSPYKEYII